jgi:hypothetical protein
LITSDSLWTIWLFISVCGEGVLGSECSMFTKDAIRMACAVCEVSISSSSILLQMNLRIMVQVLLSYSRSSATSILLQKN